MSQANGLNLASLNKILLIAAVILSRSDINIFSFEKILANHLKHPNWSKNSSLNMERLYEDNIL